jgi:hypothetical protein
MDDPYKLPLPTIPHKTMAVHGTPCYAGGVLLMQVCSLSPNGAINLQQRRQQRQLGGSAAAAEGKVRRRRRR